MSCAWALAPMIDSATTVATARGFLVIMVISSVFIGLAGFV
jgi:hypothetical protein